MSRFPTETRDSVLRAARKEFLAQGYRNAGLRKIARDAGVTTGALYGYFANKEQLFEALVGEDYRHVMELYANILSDISTQSAAGSPELACANGEAALQAMADYMYDHRESFKLLLCCSEGTPYSTMIHTMARMNLQAAHDFAALSGSAGRPTRPVNPMLEHMLISGMISTFFEIIIHDVPRQDAREYIHQMLCFHLAGWQEILGISSRFSER